MVLRQWRLPLTAFLLLQYPASITPTLSCFVMEHYGNHLNLNLGRMRAFDNLSNFDFGHQLL